MVHQRGAAAGKDESKSVRAHQTIVRAPGARPRGQLRARRLPRLVDAFEHHHLGAVDRTIGRLAAGKSRLPGQGGVAGGVDEAGRRKLDVAVTRRKVEFADAAAVARDAAQNGAEQHGDIGLANGLFDPTRQRDLVVHHHGRVRWSAAAVMQRSLRAEFAQDVIGDAVGELGAVRPVAEQAAERADDGIDCLSAERGKAVDQRDLAAETCRFERGGNSGDAGAQHADIGADTPRRSAWGPPHNSGRGRDLGLVRVHRWSARCHRPTIQIIVTGTQLAQIDAVDSDPVSPGSAARPNTIET